MHDKLTRLHAKSLFRQGWKMLDIAAEVGVVEKTVRLWRDAEGWAIQLTAEEALEARIVHLVNRGEKTEAEYRELERLIDALTRLERGKARGVRAAAGDGMVSSDDASTAPRRRRSREPKNEIGQLDPEQLPEPPLFAYQKEIADDASRFCFWLKSRQIGATTHTIAWKALKRAVQTGYTQIFLSASKRQVQVFNQSIRRLAAEQLQLELQGSKEQILLHRDGKPWGGFIFLSTNAATAQSYSGDVYIDEACWIPRFQELERVASGMATLKHFRKTYVSTPSTVTHPAWAIWKGQSGKDGQPKADTIRRIRTTVHDAIAGGNDLIDVELLRSEYSEEAFAQLFLCQPIDDEQSVFRLAQLEKCQSDAEGWQPVGRAPVWIGYDPSRTRDYACLAVVARIAERSPRGDNRPVERWRLVQREKWRDKSFRWQAGQIKAATLQYNVERIAIDVTGMGQAVYELVREFFSRVTPLTYTLETKTELVLKARQIIDDGRFEYEAGDAFVTGSFLAIKQSGTDAGRVTYKAGRNAEAGHAEAFWAIAHALWFEPLRRRSRVVMS